MDDNEKAQIAGRRCFCGWWPCDTHTDEDRIAHVVEQRRLAAERLFEPNPDKVSPDRMERSIHRSHRGEGFNDGVGE